MRKKDLGTLDRYAGSCGDFVPVAPEPHSGPRRAKRAEEILRTSQGLCRDKQGRSPWLVACGALAALPLMIPSVSVAQAPPAPAPSPPPVIAPSLPATYVVNLATPEGMSAFSAQWKNMDVKIVEAPAMPNAGPAWKSSYDITPKAGDANFDDSSWPAIEPKGLLERRGGGHLFMTWYRATLTVPAKIGDFDTAGATAVLTFTFDDYAEAWVNGQMPRRAGRPSPATIQGFNMPNRVVLGEQVKPGDKFQIAILGINGPISLAPANPVFFREAKIEFYR